MSGRYIVKIGFRAPTIIVRTFGTVGEVIGFLLGMVQTAEYQKRVGMARRVRVYDTKPGWAHPVYDSEE